MLPTVTGPEKDTFSPSWNWNQAIRSKFDADVLLAVIYAGRFHSIAMFFLEKKCNFSYSKGMGGLLIIILCHLPTVKRKMKYWLVVTSPDNFRFDREQSKFKLGGGLNSKECLDDIPAWLDKLTSIEHSGEFL